ncbi:Frr [Desulforapulum autotrophicum HRM2]|uniref:Ribosome-recycling factor n=1 Tax=Desulforapulum autotrophicum (strain ATCC 43914 / DSM 3382 / VKM B-1955 / HRM2) TaxID=177437 RepID=RRF_DESAH|nr:ribosome recycling factor [Desulforapulum autotrophicum]C0QB20.1 RecName: Full=Ribosome-recycling factor; Short=RRF; AltName: Full=Ribosome-releasing factor [Desulforapulum autotrophicum HRM2]ACN14819.1 Frr [Desulforapulum autotrophicum HRM2]
MINELYKETRDRMVKSVKTLEKEMTRVRTGRASMTMLDGVKVDYYGTLTPLNQMASIAIPESRMITVQPWDISAIKEVEKGILKANIGLTPSSDGKIIRITIPPLTEDRRREIAKTVHNTCEEFKVAVRNIRRDSNDTLKSLQKDGDISEDENFKAQKEVQDITDEFIKQIEAVFAAKEKEILEL